MRSSAAMLLVLQLAEIACRRQMLHIQQTYAQEPNGQPNLELVTR